jgi:hypothetical protein
MVVLYLFLLVFFAALFFGVRAVVRKTKPGFQRGQGIGAMMSFVAWPIVLLVIFVIYSLSPTLAEVVRIAAVGDRIEVRRCKGVFEDMQSYPAADVLFRYDRQERGERRIVHHMLVMERRGTSEKLGDIEFVPKNSFDLDALGKVAPQALADYNRGRAQK